MEHTPVAFYLNTLEDEHLLVIEGRRIEADGSSNTTDEIGWREINTDKYPQYKFSDDGSHEIEVAEIESGVYEMFPPALWGDIAEIAAEVARTVANS